jgi:hypothetical protein
MESALMVADGEAVGYLGNGDKLISHHKATENH